MFNISGEQREISRPRCCGDQRVGVSQALMAILLQKSRELFGDIFVSWDETMLQQQELDPTALRRGETRLCQQLFSRYRRVVNPVSGRVEYLAHSFDTIQIIDKNVRVDNERAWTTSHLVVLGDVFQKPFSRALISIAQSVDVGKARDRIVSPHTESSLARGCGLSKVMIDDSPGDTLLISETDSGNFALSDERQHRIS